MNLRLFKWMLYIGANFWRIKWLKTTTAWCTDWSLLIFSSHNVWMLNLNLITSSNPTKNPSAQEVNHSKIEQNQKSPIKFQLFMAFDKIQSVSKFQLKESTDHSYDISKLSFILCVISLQRKSWKKFQLIRFFSHRKTV